MYNQKIAELFEEIADMLEIEGGDHSFEIRAYRKAAMNLSVLQEDVGDILEKEGTEGLMKIPGIGKGLAERIREYVEKGHMSKYEALKKKYPIDFNSLTKIQGLGARKVLKLYSSLHVKNIEDLKKAVAQHKIRALEGFGEKSESEIAKGLQLLESARGRMPLGTALPEAESIIKTISDSGFADRVVIAGSTRRMRETVGDLDILVTSATPQKIMDLVASLKEAEHVVVSGPTKTTIQLRMGLSCDVRVVEPSSFGAALQYFTGSKEHGIAIRQIAVRKGLKLNEYGLFDKKGKVVASKTEEEIYGKLGLQYIEPEMREARGEVALAAEHRLPKLIEQKEIRGDLHTHTDNSDGQNTIEEMIEAAVRKGYSYIGLSDHSKSEYIAHGMDDKRFAKYFDEIDKVAEKYEGIIEVLKSGEVDILKDGTLDVNKSTLDRMDYRIGAVHMNRNMSRDEMTKRILGAFDEGINILAHPTGRLINEREPIDFDTDKVFHAAKDKGVIMEVNAFPNRLDLNDENIIKARSYGIKFAIDTDSHKTEHLDFIKYGIGTARRGWLTKGDVVNTLDADALKRIFR